MRAAFVLLAVSFLFAAGCSSWRNPQIEKGADVNKILQRDESYCRKVSQQMVPIQQGNELPAPTNDFIDDVSTYETEFNENQSQYQSFEHCMRARGWVKD